MTLDGGVVATRIEPVDRAEAVRLTGRLTELDGRDAELGMVRVRLPVSATAMPLAPGREVAVSGRWTGEVLEAETIEVEPRFAFAVVPDIVSVEGFVHSCTDGAGLGLDGIDLRLGPGLDVGPSGNPVVVVGVPQADGSLAVIRYAPASTLGPIAGPPTVTEPDVANRVRVLGRCQPRLSTSAVGQ